MLNKRGFTLLEVLIVVIIIGILAAIALPQYTATIEKARSSEALSNIGALRSSIDRYWYDRSALSSSYTAATLSTLDVDNPNNVINRLYNYTITDNSSAGGKSYTIRAERTSNPSTYWAQWRQDSNISGRLYKSNALGGPES